MATYDVEDPTTGKKLTLEGDSPPTEQELNDIFNTVHGSSNISESQQPSYGTKDYVGDIARPLLEGGGAAIGGMAGSTLGPIGAATRRPAMTSLPPDGFADEQSANGPPDGFADEQPEQSSFLGRAKDTLQTGKNIYDKYIYPATPIGMLTTGDAAIRSGANYLGEKVAEFGGRQGYPNTGAAVGTAVSMAPDIATSLAGIGGEAKPLLQTYKPSSFTTKAISSIFGPSTEAVAARFKNPSAIENAAPVSELAQRIPKSLQQISDQVKSGDNSAWKTLRTSYLPEDGAISKDNVLGLIKKAKDDLKVYGGGVVGKAGKQALSFLDSIAQDIQGIGKYVGGLMDRAGAEAEHLVGPNGEDIYRTLATPKNTHLPEASVKGIIQSLDQNINWDDATAGPVNSTLEKLRNLLDEQLKTGNESYRKAMGPVSDNLRLLNEAKQRFGVKNVVGEGMAPGTSTESSLANALGKNKSETQRILKDVGSNTGQNYIDDIQNARYAEQFQPGATRANGSRRVNLGGIIGGGVGKLIGGWPGAAVGTGVGSAVGGYLDTQGGAIAGKLIDTASRTIPKIANSVRSASPLLTRAATVARPLFEKNSPEQFRNEQPENSTLKNVQNNLGHRSPLNSQEKTPQMQPFHQPFMPLVEVLSDGKLQASELPHKPLTKEIARQFLSQAKGNKDLARKLAHEAGYSW